MNSPLTIAPRRWLSLALLAALAAFVSAAAEAGQLALTVIDRDTGKPIICRMHLMGANGRPRKPDKALFFHDHFVVDGKVTLNLPVGNYTFELDRGPEYATRAGHFTINNFADDAKEVDMQRHVDMAAAGWYSGDLFVRRPADQMKLLMLAEDLHLAEVVSWWNDKPESNRPLPAETWIAFDENRGYRLGAVGEARWGTTLLLLGLGGPPRPPLGEHPLWPVRLAELRETGDVWVDATASFWWDLPMLVAHGQVDSIQIANSHITRTSVVGNEADGKARDVNRYPNPWGNPQWAQHIYYQLLESGLRIPPSAGSASGMAPNPVGYNRMYVHVDGPFSRERWYENLRAGRVCVTNGPLLQPRVQGELPGHVFQAEAGAQFDFEIGLTLSTREPISYLEIVKDGQVEQSIRFQDYAKSGKLPRLTFDRSGWFLLRAVTDLPKTYRFASTGPYYVEIGYERRVSKKAAQFFVDWVFERAKQINALEGDERSALLEQHRAARDFWQDRVDKANAP
jgi:hypothetical protein